MPPPPSIDRSDVTAYFRLWSEKYGHAGIPLEDTPIDVPLYPERAIEQRHHALQQQIAQWAEAARTALLALLDRKKALLDELRVAIDQFDDEIAARRAEVEQHDGEMTSLDAGRRFEEAMPAVWLLVPFVLSILEYPVVQPAVGRLFDLSGSAQVLATVAVIIAQVATYEVTGAVAQRWRSVNGTETERRTLAGAAATGVALSALFVVGLTLVRLDQLPEDEGITSAVLLFVGIQAGFAFLSTLSGWRATTPEVASRRGLVREIGRLEGGREACQELLGNEAHQRDYVEGLLEVWDQMVRKHKESTRAVYVSEAFDFRAHLTFALTTGHGEEPVYRLEQIPIPAFPLPIDVADLGQDDDLEAQVGTFDLP